MERLKNSPKVSTSQRYLDIATSHMKRHPGEPLNSREVREKLPISRQRICSIRRALLADGHVLPPPGISRRRTSEKSVEDVMRDVGFTEEKILELRKPMRQ
jgi:hypothetical protein